MSWQPIETAPRDGTPVLAACDGHVDILAFDTWTDLDGRDVGHWITNEGRIKRPQHWMPLPEVPR